jgi:Pentapeptide repeats (8 copies)
VALPGSLLAVGALVALVAAVRGSAVLLVVAGLLLLSAIGTTALRARRYLVLRRHKVAAVGFVVVLSAAVVVPASGAVDRCARVGRGDDLSGCDLSDRDLAAEDLRGTDLRDADLHGAELAGADLRGADLRGADLSDAKLARPGDGEAASEAGAAVLDEADLRGADLSGANLAGVSAREANFEEADFTQTRLQGNDLVGTRGITGDDFVAAFSVPRTHLAGETARRGVVLQDYDEIVAAVVRVSYGQAAPEVQPYEVNSAFHPAIVIDSTLVPGIPSWVDTVREQWAPTAIRYAELVVVVIAGRQAVEVCDGYVDAATGAPAAPVLRTAVTATVRVVSAHDAHVVGEQTFRGSEPRPCLANEAGTVTELVGNPPDVGVLARPWLDGIINAPAADRIA